MQSLTRRSLLKAALSSSSPPINSLTIANRNMSFLRHNITGNAPRLSQSVQANRPLAELMTAMHTIAPLSLADTSWDNVGLLLECPTPRTTKGIHLCIDLTSSVAEEAISNPNISVVLCYHPIIFRGLKSLTLANSQQASLLRLVASGISVYSPHTSLDATPGGINDWLAYACAGAKDTSAFEGTPRPCTLNKNTPQGYEAAGMGRTFALKEAVSPATLVDRLKAALHISHVQIALPHGVAEPKIRSIAVCAGSGGSVLARDQSDAWVTGEMSHHEVLAAVAAGRTVILTNHTNTERGYLKDVLKPWLEDLSKGSLEVSVSESDRDPLVVA